MLACYTRDEGYGQWEVQIGSCLSQLPASTLHLQGAEDLFGGEGGREGGRECSRGSDMAMPSRIGWGCRRPLLS